MADQQWLDEARRYGRLPEQERAAYWAGLTAAQQQALSEALAEVGTKAPPAKQRGCFSLTMAGCGGMILGVLLTIGVEVALLMMGVQAVNDSLQSISGGSSSGGYSGSAPNPSDLENLSTQQLLGYCGTEWEDQYPRIRSVCGEQREVDRINEKVYRERAGQ